MSYIRLFLGMLFATAVISGCADKFAKQALTDASLPDKIDFNFHVKPILSDRCYKCHGPDDNARKADLRLDLKEVAFAKLKESRGRALVKGNIGRSVAWKRITSDDPDFQMPPPESNLNLSAKEKAMITKWIEQGAEWKRHWAFIPPTTPEIPEIEGQQSHNPIDNFVLAKLKEQGLSPSPEANKERLIKRVTVDLTGLPPTIKEIDDFLSDESDQAYERLVDRLLHTDAHAERMGMEWLDVARYADSQGMHGDMERYHWPWRDWVINAFKKNMPYDDFITAQIAGDLLPDATREEKLATAFHRNHPVTAEGGAINEEFKQKYVQDRTNTTATAFLGLTLECATCHDHKFDPISQKEYYQMSAFFNNLHELGMVAEGGGSSGPVLLLPDPESEEELVRLGIRIDETMAQLELTRSEVARTKNFIESIQNPAINPPTPVGVYPFESVRPETIIFTAHAHANSTVKLWARRLLANNPVKLIVDENPKSVACGEPRLVPGRFGNALRLKEEYDLVFLKEGGNFEVNQPFAAGGWIFTEKEGELQTIMGTSGDVVTFWRGWDLLLDSLNRPSVQMTSYWPHNYMQITAEVSIAKARWHHVFFTYDGSGRAGGLRLYVNGKKIRSTTDNDNLYRTILHEWEPFQDWPERPVIVGRSGRYWRGENAVFAGRIDHLMMFNKYLTPLEVKAVSQAGDIFTPGNHNPESPGSSPDERNWNEHDYLDHYLSRNHSGFQRLTKELQILVGKKLSVMENVGEIMVMEDMPEPRKTYILDRGQYDSQMEEVEPGTPQKVLAFGEELPKNRLGLAHWLVDKKNPLTARVTVNRYWQMIFGRGIVETAHDFGTQGALPTHPELLDWLAIHFIESGLPRTDPGYAGEGRGPSRTDPGYAGEGRGPSRTDPVYAGERRGWDLRKLLKTMVLSATYRQSSVATPKHLNGDAKNLYLARGPSYRLPAEMIRDNALAASGLLTQKVGGVSAKPYQPEGVWSFGSSGSYQVDSGDNLYRRSMYTFIRRTSPHPAMIAFDAPNRSVCIVKRENTNTPLQALVLLNDPQFVEASRVLAERMQKEGGDALEDQTRYAFRLVTGRQPSSPELDLLIEQYQDEAKRFEEDPKSALDLLKVGEYVFDKNLDERHTAALAMVASTILNHDEAYMKR